MAASHKGIIWPGATTAESGSSSQIIVMWPAATNKKLALANTFEEVFVCGLGPQARSSKPYGLSMFYRFLLLTNENSLFGGGVCWICTEVMSQSM